MNGHVTNHTRHYRSMPTRIIIDKTQRRQDSQSTRRIIDKTQCRPDSTSTCRPDSAPTMRQSPANVGQIFYYIKTATVARFDASPFSLLLLLSPNSRVATHSPYSLTLSLLQLTTLVHQHTLSPTVLRLGRPLVQHSWPPILLCPPFCPRPTSTLALSHRNSKSR